MTEFQIRGGYGMRTSDGHVYSNWLPIYLGETRFTKNFSVLTTTISVIANGPDGTSRNDFHPTQILKVFPALLNQQIVALMKGDAHESESAINAFVSLLRILKRLLRCYPRLVDTMKQRAGDFLRDEFKRHKKCVPDLGEFLIVLALLKEHDSKLCFDNKRMQSAVVGEFFARQILWMRKSSQRLPSDICSNFAGEERLVQMLRRSFKACEVSNRLLVYNIEVLRMFVFPGFENDLDVNYGIAPESVILRFQQRIKLIKTKMNGYRIMMRAISFSDTVTSPQAMQQLLQKAVVVSSRAGYH
ncbi:hypothetical protein HDU93_001727 [Gonapodya sp. JEL0774]|nr:hypothetical protein HDU93_001727 [Gonapodya sp. JEL0774]